MRWLQSVSFWPSDDYDMDGLLPVSSQEDAVPGDLPSSGEGKPEADAQA
ncbi:hypothetical protein J8J14_23475 [Roseomonas sp. SSH11]|uniref:Uncharacterized protein n=1 Tax=Pararoseomonas baculiformis TaxID=2820812 RepID=A0ABS4ALH2_9PROT|nr:hypothetical protein [Pararoseomonas baculiformis]MBP0447716.1 hypothetical protein [Pararoseomonas baculiformis]